MPIPARFAYPDLPYRRDTCRDKVYGYKQDKAHRYKPEYKKHPVHGFFDDRRTGAPVRRAVFIGEAFHLSGTAPAAEIMAEASAEVA